MGEDLRVTMIATGLGGAAVVAKRPLKLEVFESETIAQRTGTDGMGVQVETIDYDRLDAPAVMRKGRAAPAASSAPAFDAAEIPAFLRKQAD